MTRKRNNEQDVAKSLSAQHKAPCCSKPLVFKMLGNNVRQKWEKTLTHSPSLWQTPANNRN